MAKIGMRNAATLAVSAALFAALCLLFQGKGFITMVMFAAPVFFFTGCALPCAYTSLAVRRRAELLLVPFATAAVTLSVAAGISTAILEDPFQSWTPVSNVFAGVLAGYTAPQASGIFAKVASLLWVLPATFIALFADDAIRRLERPVWEITLALLACFVGINTAEYCVPLGLQAGLCGVAYVHAGRLAKHFLHGKGALAKGALAAVACGTAAGVGLVLLRNYHAVAPLVLRFARLGFMLGALVPCLALFGLASAIEQLAASKKKEAEPADVGADTPSDGNSLYASSNVRKKGKRIRWIDSAKGIAIIAMIVGHQSGIEPHLRMIIFSFHMPLFFIANALFIDKSYRPGVTLVRSLRSLVVPYVVVGLLEAALCGMLTPVLTDITVYQQLWAIVGGFGGTGKLFTDFQSVWLIWFVACLFVARNLYVACRWLTRNMPRWVQWGIPLLFTVLGWVLGPNGYRLPWNADEAMFAQVFMLVGDETKRRGLLGIVPSRGMLAFVAVLWVTLALGGYQLEMAIQSYPGLFICSIAACLGTYVVMHISRWLDETHVPARDYASRVLAWAGTYSMVLLGVHCLRMMWGIWSGSGGEFVLGADWTTNALLELCFVFAATYVYAWIKGLCLKTSA